MNVINLLLHIGSEAQTVEDGKQMIQDLLQKKPAGQDAVKFLQDLSALVGDAIFPLPAPLTVEIAEGIINQLVSALSGPAQALLKVV